jgi:membrane fusion protein (multidrug efflux system)
MKTIAILSAIALLAVSCAQEPVQQKAATQSLPVIELTSTTATTYQEFPASIEGALNVELRPQIEGILEQTFVDEGAFVQKGQAIFRIDSRPFKERLANANASVLAAEGTLANAKLEVEKLTPLVQNHVISDFQLKAAKTAVQVARGNLAQAKAQVGTAKIDLGYTTIKAPVSGYIGRLPKKQGSLIAPNDATALTQLSDVHNVRAYFSLGENDFVNFKAQYPGSNLAAKLKALAPVRLVLSDKTDYSIPGKIDMIDGQFDQNTAAITLRATFPNTEGLLRSGNTGKVKISLLHQNVVEIPVSSTIELQDKVFAFAVGDSNKVSRQALTIIGKSGDKYIIGEGLKAGQRIVLSGIDRLQEGTVIDPQKAPGIHNVIAKN